MVVKICKRLAVMIGAVIFTICLFYCKSDNTYTVLREDSITTVKQEKSTSVNMYICTAELVVGDEKSAVLSNPKDLKVSDNGNIYIVDDDKVKAFKSDGRFIKNVGGNGEGPGEYRWPIINDIRKDIIYINDAEGGNKDISLYNLKGKFLRTVKIPFNKNSLLEKSKNNAVLYLLPNDNYFICSSLFRIDGKHLKVKRAYGIMDKNGNLAYKLSIKFEDANIAFSENPALQNPFIMFTDKNIFDKYIYILECSGDNLYKFNMNGELINKVHFELKPDKIPANYKDQFIKGLKNIKVTSVDLPYYYPLFSDLVVDDNNRIWLKKGNTIYKEQTQQLVSEYSYLIYDENFKYVGSQSMPIDVRVIKGNKAYGFYTSNNGTKVFKRFNLVKK